MAKIQQYFNLPNKFSKKGGGGIGQRPEGVRFGKDNINFDNIKKNIIFVKKKYG
jgi:hypothetical protein